MTDNKYANGKIYRIVDIGFNKCYIGSTVQPLCKRMSKHRTEFKGYRAEKTRFMTSFGLFEEYGVENCKIELIEEYSCETKEQLLQREGYYIRLVECVNKVVPDRNKKEYMQEYYLKNRGTIAQQRRQYTEKNKETISEYRTQYHKNNKETIIENKKEKITCLLCGGISRRGDIAKHQRTAKCQSLRESQV